MTPNLVLAYQNLINGCLYYQLSVKLTTAKDSVPIKFCCLVSFKMTCSTKDWSVSHIGSTHETVTVVTEQFKSQYLIYLNLWCKLCFLYYAWLYFVAHFMVTPLLAKTLIT